MKNRNRSQWRQRTFVGWALALGMVLADVDAQGAQTLRVQVDQKGDFLLIGNTLGHECAGGTPAPIVGTVGMCGANVNDSAPDVFWRSESPMANQAEANNTITAAQARSTAVLSIPAGATVTHAFLYWGATIMGGDMTATLDRPGGFSQDLNAIQLYTSLNNSYQSVADITAIVQAQGSGAYRVSGVDSVNVVDLNSNNSFAGWWMVVFYQLNSDPPRNLALFDGFDNVSNGNPQNLMLNGFFVPVGFTAGKLGIVTFEGDNTINGDSFSFGPAPELTDANNPANNFFNGTHSHLGMPVTTPGDLPQLAGTPQSMSGMDIDVVDVTSKLTVGMMSAPISATSTGDNYYLAGFVTSIPTFRPDFSTSEKSAVDINGGSLRPGDIVGYTVVATNTGNDTSVGTVMTDHLPMGVTFVPGSISITAGANIGAKTDMTADDQCEYAMASRTITCRLGTGANDMIGGQMLVGESSTVVFRVTIDPTATGTILNQANINAGGLLGAPADDTPTDGNGVGNGGQPPTPIFIEECSMDAQCKAPTPYCNFVPNPNVCVECFTNGHCPAMKPSCHPNTNTCECIPSGMDVCDGVDNDCDGVVDPNCTDTDGDVLTTVEEFMLGTDPNDADSDDDGVFDGQEANPAEDTDGDGKINVLDPDSDNDGLFDGTEMGFNCSNPATDASKMQCLPDGDMGTTKTDPLDPDTDNGGVSDGVEDGNGNGLMDTGETNPLDPSDDKIVAACGNGLMDPGEVCDDGNSLSNDGCDDNCTPTSCGNGKLTTGEECDDGNTVRGDGCSAACVVETAVTDYPGPDEPAGCACSTPDRSPNDLPLGSALLLGLYVWRRRIRNPNPYS